MVLTNSISEVNAKFHVARSSVHHPAVCSYEYRVAKFEAANASKANASVIGVANDVAAIWVRE